MDDSGVPIKKVRRKGAGHRAQSQVPVRKQLSSERLLRAQSVGAPLRRKPGEYVDSKGRRIVIEEDGTKTVFDKNGKRLRPKKKLSDGLPKSPKRKKSQSPSQRRLRNGNIQATVQLSPDVNKHEVGERISEIDRENLELKMNLMQAKDQADDLATKAQKEKAKNVKAMAETEQLRSKHGQTVEDNRTLGLKVKNLEARLSEMDQKIDAVKSMPLAEESVHTEYTADHLKSQLTKLKEQNLSLLNKLDAQKSRSITDSRVKGDQIGMLNEKLMKIREENDLLFSGEMDPDTVRAKLLRDKKSLEQRIANAKKETNEKLKEMQTTMDQLTKANADLKKKVGKATLAINEDDDEDIRRAKEMAQAVSKTGIKNAAKAKRASIQINSGNHDSRGDGGFGLQQLSAFANKSISGIAL
ncbi:MAG: hypothetical protein SGARI_003396 [Bacillariaceae sp.]